MLPSGHHITDERIMEFQRIYREAYSEDITVAVARDIAHRLVALYKLIIRPLPDEMTGHSATLGAQTVDEEA